jgi:tight adherence protein B
MSSAATECVGSRSSADSRSTTVIACAWWIRMRKQRADAASGLEAVASVVQRLAVLLSAGVVPAAGWGYLVQDGDAGILRAVADEALAGQPVAPSLISATEAERETPLSQLNEQAWRGLAAAWQVASDAGASLAPSLRQFASSLRDLAQTERDISVALAGPVATARMVMVLPVIGVLFGLALGFNTLGVLFTTVPGWLCLALGTALLLAARSWNHRLVARARPVLSTPGLELDLMAIAVSGGGSLDRAASVVSQAQEDCGLEVGSDSAAIDDVLSLSRRAGVPAAELLRSEAEEQRRTARSAGQRAAATLAVTLMLPLGLCILPSFMLLGVAPLLIAIVSSTVATF